MVGSGPAAWAAIVALVDRGERPIVLDIGRELEPGPAALKARLARSAPTEWSRADVEQLEANASLGSHLPRPASFGSTYPYADGGQLASPVPSVSRGGLSTVWTSAMLPAHDRDTDDWPVRQADLAPHYRAVLQRLPLSAAVDGLEPHFPLFHAQPLPPIPNAATAPLEGGLAKCGRSGVASGRARLAFRSPNSGESACQRCAHCHSGCAYDAIWSTAPEIARLAATSYIDYRPGITVRSLAEDRTGVVVEYVDVDGARGSVHADRVFLGAGAIASTRIVLDSLERFDEPVRLLSTQAFAALIVPMVPRRCPPPDITLPTLFVECEVPESDHWFHAQVGQANELVVGRLLGGGSGSRMRRLLVEQGVGRCLVALVNAHSDHGGHLRMTLRRTGSGSSRMEMEPVAADGFPALARRVARRIGGALLPAGAVMLPPVGPLVSSQPVGWHVGGSLPMRNEPRSPLDTDVLGTPNGWSRVHVVDGSVLPSIPGTTVSLPIMANAHRIASAAS